MAMSTLMSCANSFEAQLIKGRLETEGIPCILQGENSSFIRAGYGFQAGFEVNILVRDEDMDLARSILHSGVEYVSDE